MPARKLAAALALALATLIGAPSAALAVEGGGGGPAGHAEEECIKLLEQGAKIDDCQEAPNPILPEWNELIWGAISFLALLLLLWKFAFPALNKGMRDRSEKIRSSLDEAASAREEAQAVLADYQRQLADAKGEAGRIIEEARETADSLKRDLTARAEAEAAEQRERNAQQIAAERDRVMSELQSQVATLAIELAEKVVEGSLDREANLRLIENYINSVGGNGSAPSGAGGARSGS